jgi:glycosyltransferase involved in cell wall biosynthesis
MLGYSVAVTVRSRYMRQNPFKEWRGVRFLRIWSPRSRRLETIVHSVLGVLLAAIRRPDILHIHGVGPALTAPLARLAGLRVVVTHHGADYEREKWGAMEKAALRAGEGLGMRCANAIIVISRGLQELVARKYHREARIIPNGVSNDGPVATEDALRLFDLQAGQYVLCVGRLVPEKRQIDLIEAFAACRLPGWKLVLVGGADHQSPYDLRLRELAAATPGVVTTGVQTGQALAELYSHAGLFVLPSSHEGLPISLLEAMSYGLPVLVSDIAPHLELELDRDQYFRLGDIPDLTAHMTELATADWTAEKRRSVRDHVMRKYNWHHIAEETAALYDDVAGRRRVDATVRPASAG